MDKFDYFRKGNAVFLPKTPAASLRGIEKGYPVVESYIHLGTSVKALDEEPYDLDDLERILAREDLDLNTNSILLGIFEKLISSTSSETALFAAEGINLIESRYFSKIERLKKGKKKLSSCVKLARLFFELSVLNRTKETIRRFYLRESYRYLNAVRKREPLGEEDAKLYVSILSDLKLYHQAMSYIESLSYLDRSVMLVLKLKVEFLQKHYQNVCKLAGELQALNAPLDENLSTCLGYWLSWKEDYGT